MSETVNDSTSSIGPLWPPEPTTHERVRGFYTLGVVRSPTEADAFAEAFYSSWEDVRASADLGRLSLRVITSMSGLQEIRAREIPVEAAVPLPVSLEDLHIVYVGRNKPERALTEKEFATHAALLDAVSEKLPALHQVPSGLEVAVAGRGSNLEWEQKQFTQLYAPFNYSEADVAHMLGNPANIIMYATDGEVIASTAMIEQATVRVGGLHPINIAEITEAKTRDADPDYRRKGLYTTLSRMVVNQVCRNSSVPLHAIIGEGNCQEPGVLRAAYNNGRRFSHSRAVGLGLSAVSFGFLPQNFQIKSNQGNAPAYNDFAVSYVPL